MINLVVDIGNTTTKVALFQNRKIIEYHVLSEPLPHHMEEITKNKEIYRAIISSVSQSKTHIENYIKNSFNTVPFHSGIKVRFVNQYKTPQTLGLDRLAAIVAAEALFPNKNCLIIDAGTCITYDFLDKDKNYRGGNISPGLNMRFRAMHHFTGRLPLVKEDAMFTDRVGMDTETAIRAGVQQGMYSEIEGMIQHYIDSYQQIRVILCGGDAFFFDTRLKNSIFADIILTEPHWVLIGLNELIHQYHD